MDFRPARSRGGITGLALLAASLATEAGLLIAIRQIGLGPPAAVLLIAAVLLLLAVARLAYWVWGYFSLRYGLSRNGIEIRWATSRQLIPMSAITHLLGGRPYLTRLRGLHWPGYHVGRTQVAPSMGEVRETLVYATTPPEGQLVVVTPDLAYAISPTDRAAFVEEFKLRRRLGPVQDLKQETTQIGWARLTIWRDGLALRLVTAGVVLNLLAFAWLVWHYPGLPEQVAVQYRFDPVLSGPMAVARPREVVWTLPLIGLTTLVANTGLAAAVHAHGRLAAVLLALGALIVQLALGVVLVRMI